MQRASLSGAAQTGDCLAETQRRQEVRGEHRMRAGRVRLARRAERRRWGRALGPVVKGLLLTVELEFRVYSGYCGGLVR